MGISPLKSFVNMNEDAYASIAELQATYYTHWWNCVNNDAYRWKIIGSLMFSNFVIEKIAC